MSLRYSPVPNANSDIAGHASLKTDVAGDYVDHSVHHDWTGRSH